MSNRSLYIFCAAVVLKSIDFYAIALPLRLNKLELVLHN